jgi:NADH-quinone oxidoreductase subunit C
MLMDLTAVDWLDQGPARAVQRRLPAVLVSTHNQYFRVKAWVPEDDPSMDSATAVWASANWGEREIWDLYGIRFEGHPDLKRILLPESYTGHPLRKDYPLTGRGERYDFPKHTR